MRLYEGHISYMKAAHVLNRINSGKIRMAAFSCEVEPFPRLSAKQAESLLEGMLRYAVLHSIFSCDQSVS